MGVQPFSIGGLRTAIQQAAPGFLDLFESSSLPVAISKACGRGQLRRIADGKGRTPAVYVNPDTQP